MSDNSASSKIEKNKTGAEEKISVHHDRSQRASRRRVLTLLPGGPMIVDLWLEIDGRPATEGIDDLANRVLEASDTDHDGRTSWDELIANTEFHSDALGARTAAQEEAPDKWKEKYDFDRNGKIDSDEAQAWLGRGQGRQAKTLTLDGSRSYLYDAGRSSPLWRLLDADRDGLMTTEEIEKVSSSLLARDADDNFVIAAWELDTLSNQVRAAEGNMARQRKSNDRRAALLLDSNTDWYRVLYLLGDLYAPRRNLSPQSFALFPDLFERLDADQSGRLTSTEIAELENLNPDLILEVAFGSGGSEDSKDDATPRLTLSGTMLERGLAKQISASRCALLLPDSSVVFSAHDMLPPTTDATNSMSANALENTVEDTVENTVETTDEPEQDAAESGASTLLRQPSPASHQIRLMLHDQGDTVFGHLDQDRDGQLGEREIAQAAQRLKSLDANDDQQIVADELPRQWTFAILRGEQQLANRFFVPKAAPTTTNNPNSPAWFTHADFNGDGEISRREFLGTKEQFDRLDTNNNGFIESSEAAPGE